MRDVSEKGVIVELSGPIKRGDGVVFDRGAPEEGEEGGSVFEVFDSVGKSVGIGLEDQRSEGKYRLTFGRSSVDLNRIKPGDRVWRSRDASFDQRAKDRLRTREKHLTQVQVVISGSIGTPLEVILIDGDGRKGVGRTASSLQTASSRPISRADLLKAVGLLGDSPYALDSLDEIDTSGLDDGLFVPLSEVKVARRLALEALTKERTAHSRAEGLLKSSESMEDIDKMSSASVSVNDGTYRDGVAVIPLCRTPQQVEAVCSIPWVTEVRKILSH